MREQLLSTWVILESQTVGLEVCLRVGCIRSSCILWLVGSVVRVRVLRPGVSLMVTHVDWKLCQMLDGFRPWFVRPCTTSRDCAWPRMSVHNRWRLQTTAMAAYDSAPLFMIAHDHARPHTMAHGRIFCRSSLVLKEFLYPQPLPKIKDDCRGQSLPIVVLCSVANPPPQTKKKCVFFKARYLSNGKCYGKNKDMLCIVIFKTVPMKLKILWNSLILRRFSTFTVKEVIILAWAISGGIFKGSFAEECVFIRWWTYKGCQSTFKYKVFPALKS